MPARHLAGDGEHRALGGLADGAVGALGGAGHAGGEHGRADELARAGDEFLDGAADQLREDHAGVAARTQQGGAADGFDDLVAADLVERLVGRGEAVELLEHGAHRERHVVARVAVGDREDVEVVDLLAARSSSARSSGDERAQPDDRGIGQETSEARGAEPGRLDGLDDLAGLEAARARVLAARRRP